jgi:hypothetical protein
MSTIVSLLEEWDDNDHHHDKDPAFRANFDAKMSNSRITERLIKSKGRIRKIPKGMEEILADVSDPDV